jgi:hypothetical protein
MLAVTTYGVVLALHIMAVLLAYGLPLAYPLMLPWLRRRHPRAMPGVHEVQHRLNIVLTGPGTVLVLAFGLYLASRRHAFDELWVQVPLGIIVLIGVIGAWVVRASERMAALSAADVAAAPAQGAVAWSAAYESLYARYVRVELFLGAIVLIAVFFMAAKPG